MRRNIEMREIDRLRDSLAEAERERQSIRNTCVALDKYNDELESLAERAESELANLHASLADAHELLREAIPHLVGNNYWDGVARIRAHLELAEANEMVIIDPMKEKRISKE